MKYATTNKGNVLAYPVLLAGAFFAFLALVGMNDKPPVTTNISLVPDTTTVTIGNTFTANVIVTSDTPVNVFAGKILFDETIAVVEDIEYNTSIANLWTEEPWYQNGDGTISFAGGTTAPGGFVGNGSLMTITFRSLTVGKQLLSLTKTKILEHDGLGTETDVLSNDVLVTIQGLSTSTVAVATEPIKIIVTSPVLDLTGDGKISIADVSAFFTAMIRNDLRADFNNDGRVTTADLSILLSLLGTTIAE